MGITRPDDPIHFRVRGWLENLIADTTVELLKHGTATVITWRGSVHAALTRPTRSRHGWLGISNDAGGSAGMALTSESEKALLVDGGLRRYLGLVVTNLVNN